MTRQPRRRFLGGAFGLFGLGSLAGCTSDGGDSGDSGGDGGATDSPTSAPTDSPTGTATPGDTSPDHTVVVGPGGSLVFDPAELVVAPGDTVAFSWESDFHSVTVDTQPSGADWSGTGETTHDAGFTHTHTFDVAGTYDYYCRPHRSAGMTGTVQVGEGDGGGGSTTTGGDGTPPGGSY
jgi:plastocyanin